MLSDFRHPRSSLGFYLIEHSSGGFLWNRLLERICLSSAMVLREAVLFWRAEVRGAGRDWIRFSRGLLTLELEE